MCYRLGIVITVDQGGADCQSPLEAAFQRQKVVPKMKQVGTRANNGVLRMKSLVQ